MAFFLKNSCWMSKNNRVFACGLVNKECVAEVDKEAADDVKEEQENEYTEQEREKREDRRTRYKQSTD